MPAKMQDSTREQIALMLEAGVSPDNVHLEMPDVAMSTIYKIRRECGIVGRVHNAFEGLNCEEMIVDYQNGMKGKDLAKKHNCSVYQIYQVLQAYDVPTKLYDPQTAATRKRQYEEAISLYQQGYSIREIIENTGVQQTTLHQKLYELNIPLRRPRTGMYAHPSETPVGNRTPFVSPTLPPDPVVGAVEDPGGDEPAG